MASSRASVSDSLQFRYSCPVCLEPLRFPKLLPCGHTFCYSCLVQAVLQQKKALPFPCPSCREPIKTVRAQEDVATLPNNFYVTHADIERSRLVVNKNCPQHAQCPLTFLCLDCDTFVCSTCRLATHAGHKTKDLTLKDGEEGEEAGEAGGSGVGQGAPAKKGAEVKALQKNLKASVVQFRKEQRRLRDKGEVIARQIRSHARLIAELAERSSEGALRRLGQDSRREHNKLQASIDRMEQLLSGLASKRKANLPQALEEAEKASKQTVPACKQMTLITKRRTAKDLRRVANLVGYPAVLTVDRLRPLVTMQKLFRVDAEADSPSEGRQGPRGSLPGSAVIRCLCPLDQENVVWVLYHVSGPRGKDQGYEACYTRKGKLLSKAPSKVDYTLHVDHGQLNRQHGHSATTYLTKGYSSFVVGIKDSDQILTLFRKPDVYGGEYEVRVFMSFDGEVESFDVCPGGEFFALLITDKRPVDQGQGPGPKADTLKRTSGVFLYHMKEWVAKVPAPRDKAAPAVTPCALYQPPNESLFSPSDLCFFPLQGTSVLLVADWMSDAVHVLHLGDGGLTFARYLDTGRPGSDVVKPLTLVPDSRGQLLIGCGDGQVLLCVPCKA